MNIFQNLWNTIVGLFTVTSVSSTELPEDSNLSARIGVRDYSAEHKNLLASINDARSSVQPLAHQMNYLDWDDELAKQAGQVVSNCEYANYDGNNDVIFSSHSGFDKNSADDLVNAWISAAYDMISDICSSSMKICNDLKLLTRGDSTNIGCATNVCQREPDQEPVHVTACKFDQTLTSGPPYLKSNKSCTGCSANQKCFKNLCRNSSHVDDDTTTVTSIPEATTIANNETIPILIHGKPNLGNISRHANETNGTSEASKWRTIVQGRGVSWVAFIVLCVILAITFVLAVWAFALAQRLKSKMPVDGKNF